MAFFGLSIGGIALVPALGFELFGGSIGWTWVLCLSVIAAAGIPVFMIVYWIVKWSRERKHPSLRFWVITLLIWFMSLGGLSASVCKIFQENGTNITAVIESLENMEEPEDWDE